MISLTIADTGVIVALIYKKDQWHEWILGQAANLPVPFLTCEAVITEACHLLKGAPNGVRNLFEMLRSGALEVAFDLSNEVESIGALLEKYKDVPMDFADACLVRMSELQPHAVVLTVDGDFRIYRRNRRQRIPLIIPGGV